VYDLGVAPRGYAYFTMKRIRGRTLDEILKLLAAGDAAAAAKYTRRRLLTAFGSVCQAIDFAHQRGVLHRDLKPSNVILGDYGEVYVLDWGLAKAAGVEDRAGEGIADLSAAPGGTLQGTLLGTPGYMAPEQARGEIDRLDERTDVYALGAILFEIMALQPLHRAHTVEGILASTHKGADGRPSARGARDVPPEIEAICVQATAADPAGRHASARELAEALERFLDGDRNEALRRELAVAHVAAARAALDRAEPGGVADRALAMREAASALALDPSNAEALVTMAELLVAVPSEVPPEAQAGLDATAEGARRSAARLIATRFVLWIAFLPLALWMGVHSAPITIGTVALIVLCGGISWLLSRGRSFGLRRGLALLVLSSVTVAMMSALFGPFILVPGLAATNTMFFAMSADRRARHPILAAGVLVVLAPYLLELAAVIPPAYAFHDGLLQVLPRAMELPPLQTMLCLAVISVAMVIIPGVAVGRLRDRLSAAEQRLHLQAWNLRQLVPSAARHALAERG
jgi:serine/threonine-protein kinase